MLTKPIDARARYRAADRRSRNTGLANKIIEQVNSFNYLENMVSYEKQLDIYNKLHKYWKITGILNYAFGQQKPP